MFLVSLMLLMLLLMTVLMMFDVVVSCVLYIALTVAFGWYCMGQRSGLTFFSAVVGGGVKMMR